MDLWAKALWVYAVVFWKACVFHFVWAKFTISGEWKMEGFNYFNRMLNKRTIKIVRDKNTREVHSVDKLLKTQKQGFELRDDISIKIESFVCCECDQDLKIASSIKSNLYFSHKVNSEYCLLKKDDLKNEVDYILSEYLKLKESPRHKFLKNKIGESLKFVEGVDVGSIKIDNKFIISDNERRKPDVYCKYKGKELVFEVQLSPLSLSYINQRSAFYRRNDIFLIWILDGNVEGHRKQLTRDIKWLDTHQNLFSLSEQSAELKLTCNYKIPFIGANNKVWDKWIDKTITLSDLTFDTDALEVYFFNFNKERKSKENEVIKIIKATLEQEEKLARIEREKNIMRLLKSIKTQKEAGTNFYYLQNDISNLSGEGVIMLNERLKLKNTYKGGIPVVSYYIRNYKDLGKSKGHSFIKFLLSEENIYLSINDKDDLERGCLQELYENKSIEKELHLLLPSLFIRGYELTEFDKKYLLSSSFDGIKYPEVEYLKLQYYNALPYPESIKLIKDNFNYLLFIESALQGRTIGPRKGSWAHYMLPIISNKNQGYWFYTQKALKQNGVWNLISQTDTKGTFKRKIEEFKLESAEEDNSISELLICLYPEIFMQ